jgi:sulfhydrogenase subunit beta (sulfur reductase)
MDTGIIKKTNVKAVIEGLMQMGEVIAPIRTPDYYAFSPLTSAEAACLDYTNSKLSPKGCFFPQSEVLFYYEKEGNKTSEPPKENKQGYLLGIRPCDARALALLDPVFADAAEGAASSSDRQYQDVYYQQKRQNRIIIGLACTSPQSTCFCTSIGGSPLDTTGMDMLWQDLGDGGQIFVSASGAGGASGASGVSEASEDRYLIKPITSRGQELLAQLMAKLPLLVEKAGQEDLAEAKEQEQKILQKMPPIFDAEAIADKLSSSFNDPAWQVIQEKCLGCATCAFVCPTCHCFDIQDENKCGKGRRVRLWDSCQLCLFTLHTSGHNPRPSGKERLRQRVMHKFNYFKTNNGQIACVGCGRCIKECPVNMDIRQIISAYTGGEATSAPAGVGRVTG